jgi:hypothetical protein
VKPVNRSILLTRLVEAGLDPRYAAGIADNLTDPIAQALVRDLAPVTLLEGSGWFACPNALLELGLTLPQLGVLVCLIRRAGPDGGSWPAQGTVAKALGINRRTVQRALRVLVDRGLVLIHKRRTSAGGDTTNHYRLRFPKSKTAMARQSPRGGAAQDRTGGGTMPHRRYGSARKVDKDKGLSTMASPVDNPNGTDPEGGTDVRLLKQRFDTTPEAIPPDLHQIIAKWVLAVSRTTDNQRDKRTREAVKALIEITGWSEEQVRQAMTKVADNLSPTPVPTP